MIMEALVCHQNMEAEAANNETMKWSPSGESTGLVNEWKTI